jgi:hypothetical protein
MEDNGQDVVASGVAPDDDGCGGKKKKGDSAVIQRFDVYEDWDLFKFKKTPEGYLTGYAVVTNIGVFSYDKEGAPLYELRHPEDVFASASLDTYKNKPMTNDHPFEMVDVSNVEKYQVGFTGSEVINDPYHVIVPLTITDAQTIQDIENGKRGLSCGYTCELEDAEPGAMYLGVPYNKRQKNIQMNHIAVVDKGRAGDAARMRLDSQSDVVISTHRRDTQMADVKLRTVNLDGVDFQAEDKVIEALKTAEAKADAASKAVETVTAEKSAIEAERDLLKGKCDSLGKENEGLKAAHLDEAEIEKRVSSRIALRLVADKAGVEVKDGMDEKAIKIAIVQIKAPSMKLDGKATEYIDAAYDLVQNEDAASMDPEADEATRKLNEPNLDGIEPAKGKRQAMIARLKNGNK